MHFNPEGNHYITLGIPQNLSQEELGRRWKKLMLLYHPDRQRGNEEWVTERAKKVNEAYATLKDESKRAEYDRRLSEQILHQKFAATVSETSPLHHSSSREFQHRSRRGASSEDRNMLRRYMPKILFGVYVLIALVVFGFIYLQNRSSQLEAELVPAPAKTVDRSPRHQSPQTSLMPPPTEEKSPEPPVAILPEKREQDQVKPKSTKVTPSPIQAVRKWFQPKEEKQETPQGTSPAAVERYSSGGELKPRAEVTTSLFPDRPPPSEQKPPEPRGEQQAPHTDTARAFFEQTQPQQSMKKAAPETRQQPAPVQKPDAITKEEVEEFMQRYVRAYTTNDLNTFMSLFSRSAVENNSMTYNDIRKAYKETFSEKINYYKVLNMDIRTNGQSAYVNGIYNIDRYISSEDRWVKYSGRINWKLIREHNQILVISITYDK